MSRNIFKYIVIIIITVVIAIAFTGSHSVQSVDDLAYVVALGVDVGDTENLKVTFQFTMPSVASEDGSSGSSPSVIDSVEASSIDSAINLMNAYVSKEINLSHCKIIVFSEELAKSGISTEVYSLMNKVQIRPDTYVIVSTCTAKEYIESVSPSLENLVAKFYEVITRSSEYTGYTINSELGDFFNSLVGNTSQPTAILGSLATDVENTEESSSDSSGSSDSGSSSDGSSDSSSGSGSSGSSESSSSEAISAKNGIENLGVAVFKNDKLVGKLTAEETIAHLLLIDELKNCNITITDPESENKQIDLYLTTNHEAKIDVDIVNGTPYITVDVAVNAKISSIDYISQELSEERLSLIEQSASNYLKELISNYLYKTAKELHSDIAGFGKYALSQFTTTTEFEEYNWLEHYQDSFFEVSSDVSIDSRIFINRYLDFFTLLV